MRKRGGGSAAQAQHFAAELTIRFETERDALPAISLTTDTSALTAGANDYGYETVFERQVEALARKGDVLVGLTTSGNSENVLRAFKAAKKKGAKTVCLTGKDGGSAAEEDLDSCIVVPSERTAHIQEAHIAIIHAWCTRIDEALTDV